MKRIINTFITLSFILLMCTTSTYAKETIIENTYLDNGIYIETIIGEYDRTTYATNTKTGYKIKNFKNDDGDILYTLRVDASFTYNGSSSTCTSASSTGTAPASTWTVIQTTASKSGNTATAKGIYNQHYLDRLIQTKTHTITLTCSNTGVLN